MVVVIIKINEATMIRKYIVKDKIVSLYDGNELIKTIPNDNNVLDY